MTRSHSSKDIYTGVSLAVLATLIWSGNFIISKGVSKQIGPVSLAFFRWLTATILITPLAWRKFRQEIPAVKANWKYLFWVSLCGITLFNTCIYFSGHYTSAINMALIGTTSSPIFATLFALLFLKEKITGFRLLGMLICISGILLLLSKGSIEVLAAFHFSKGDLWILSSGFVFAIYSTLVRKKPTDISSINFLFVIFAMGVMMLFPMFLIELFVSGPPQFNNTLIGSILYLGAGASIVSFLSWNVSIQKLGAGRTVLFGNLTPVFSTFEAVLILHEKITTVHIISGALVISGLILANTIIKKKTITA